IYGVIRRRGYSHEQAEDLVQEFSETRLLQKWNERESFVHKADRAYGKFRSFLSQVLIRFLQDKTKSANVIKAGGRIEHVSAEVMAELAESGHTLPGSIHADLGREFDLEYARVVIDLATQHLKHVDHHLAVLMGKKRRAKVAEALGM